MEIQTHYVPGQPTIALDIIGAGPVVLFLHGIGGNRTNWHEQMHHLAPRFRAVAWDMRGYGQSEDYAGGARFSDFADDLLRVLDYLQAPSVHLVGLSLGGLVAQDFYRRHPERIVSLVLADTRNSLQRHNNREFLERRQAPLLAGLTPSDIAAQLAQEIAGPNASREVVAQLESSVAALHKESYLKMLECSTTMAEDADFRGSAVVLDLVSVKVPVLVVCGEADQITPPAMSEAIVRGVPLGRLCLIAGAGHLSNLESPEEFNDILMEFLCEQTRVVA